MILFDNKEIRGVKIIPIRREDKKGEIEFLPKGQIEIGKKTWFRKKTDIYYPPGWYHLKENGDVRYSIIDIGEEGKKYLFEEDGCLYRSTQIRIEFKDKYVIHEYITREDAKRLILEFKELGLTVLTQ